MNSLSLSGSAAPPTLVIGITLAYSRRLHDTRGMQVLMRLSSLGYAMPGAVLAVGVIVPLAGFDNWLDSLMRSEEHTSELQSRPHLVCRLLLEKKKKFCFCPY